MNRQFRLPLIAAALLASIGSGIYFMLSSSSAAEPAIAAKPVLTVNIATPLVQEWDKSLSVSGGLFAWQESIVAAELGGLAIIELNADVGSVVKQGQVLARLSQDAAKASLAVQQANVARAKAGLAEAAANAERVRQVKGSGALSEQQIQQYLIAEESAKAGLAAAEAAQRADEVRLRQTSILAADGGVISSRSATLGAVVQPGGELFRLVRQGRIEWRAELTAEQLAQVRVGQKAHIRLPDGKTVDGTLRMLSPTLDSNSRKALAYVDLASGSTARAGMFAQGELLLGRSAALTVPHAALLLRDGNAYVFELGSDNRVAQRKVQTGRRNGEAVEILDGLAKTARVVVSGGAFLNQGDLVREATANNAAAGKAEAK
jgi:RND family efflux transporter MFP subunit